MIPRNSHSYLETQVLTSPPQKLQLILIEAALRFAKKAELLREDGEEEVHASEAIGRAQKIVSEIIGGLNAEVDPELVGNIAAIYIFISRSLSQAYSPENKKALADAIRILEQERITWRMVCEKIAVESSDQNEAAVLHHQSHEKRTFDIDSLEMHSTAGSATMHDENLFSPSPSSAFPLGSNSSFSATGNLAGPKGLSKSHTEESPTGFSIDA